VKFKTKIWLQTAFVAAVILGILIILAIFIHPGANTVVNTPDPEGKVAGFWKGLVHGATISITFIMSLFNDSVNIYAVHNNGGWYNFGFAWGLTPLAIALRILLWLIERRRRRDIFSFMNNF